MVIRTIQWMMAILIGLCACAEGAWAASAGATLDRSITSAGESVLLEIHVDGSADEDPDLSVLQRDFDILSQSQSSNYSLINGQMSRSQTWSVNLMPRHEGNITIPAISLGNIHTQPLHLQVLPASQSGTWQDKDIYLEVSSSSKDVYVQAQVVLTVKLFRAVNLAQAQLTEVDLPHATIKKMGEDKNYETVREQRRFIVTERRYALFPEQSGVLHVPALQFTGRIVTQSGFFNQAGRVVRVQSKPLDITVHPIPANWDASRAWLPASELTVEEISTDDESELTVGEPFTRTIEVRAEGLTAEQLPPIFAQREQAGFKIYPDKPELVTQIGEHGLIGIRREKVAMIPTQAGDVKLPAIAIPWWNTQTQSIQTSKILPRMLHIQPAEHPTQNTSTPAAPEPVTQAEKSIPAMPEPSANTVQNQQGNMLVWQLLTVFFALAWLITLALWWRSAVKDKSPVRKDVDKVKATVSLQALRKQLESACKQNHAKDVERLLPQWAALFYQDASISCLAHLKGRDDALDKALSDLEASLYAPKGNTWRGHVMLKVITSLQCSTQSASVALGLKALHN